MLYPATFPRGSSAAIRPCVNITDVGPRNYIDKMQQYGGIYLLQIYSTCFGCPSHPSSGVHKTVTAAFGTGHNM